MLATLPGAKMPASPKCSEKWVSISSDRRANGEHSSWPFAGVRLIRQMDFGVPRRGHCPPRSRSLSLHIRRWRVRCDSTARESTRSRRALPYLKHAYDERDPWLLNVQVDPAMDSMRSLPGFRDLVRRIGLPFHWGVCYNSRAFISACDT